MVVVAVLLVALPAGVGAQVGDAGRGGDVYRERCVLCHGGQGQGWDWSQKVPRPPVPVPDLARVLPQRSDEFLFAIVKGGGEAVGRTRFMPPFEPHLTDAEIWDIVAFLRSLGRGAGR
jgi:mono/diheme cytochrome c family protein